MEQWRGRRTWSRASAGVELGARGWLHRGSVQTGSVALSQRGAGTGTHRAMLLTGPSLGCFRASGLAWQDRRQSLPETLLGPARSPCRLASRCWGTRPGRAGRRGTRNNLVAGGLHGPSLPFLQSTRRQPSESGLPSGLSYWTEHSTAATWPCCPGTQCSFRHHAGHPPTSHPCLEHVHCLSRVLAEEEAAAAGGIGGCAECVNL